MFIVPVQKRSSKSKKADGKPKAEYRARSLNGDDIQKMSSDELRFHEIHNRANLDAALKADPKPPKATERTIPESTKSVGIKELGERMGWTAREITYEEIQDMPANEVAWNQMFNAENWRIAFERQETARNNKQHMQTQDVRRMWSRRGTAEEFVQTKAAGDEFAKRNPRCLETRQNAEKLIAYMKQNDLTPTDVRSWQTAFNALVESGEIKLAEVESADAYYRNHPELHSNQIPPLVAARQAKAQATKQMFEQAKANTASAGATEVITYPNEQSGYPSAPTKYSFRKLLDSLDSESYARRLREDPQFAAAVDRIEQK